MASLPQLTDALLSLENGVAVLTLNRHDLRNALTGSHLIDDIVTTAEWVNHCQDVSVLVITGAGSAFSACGNIRDMANRSVVFAGISAECAELFRMLSQIIYLPLPDVEY